MKNPTDPIGNRTRDPPACSATAYSCRYYTLLHTTWIRLREGPTVCSLRRDWQHS